MSSDEHAAIRAWSQRIVRSNLELACACGFPGFFFFLPKISESFYQAFQGFGGSFKQRFWLAIVDFANVQSCMMRSVIQHLFQFLCVVTRILLVVLRTVRHFVLLPNPLSATLQLNSRPVGDAISCSSCTVVNRSIPVSVTLTLFSVRV